ncbi:Oligosaccharide translocation protein rft1 [Linnemannia schmuckeri]|uniref:Man(5)GlcNAc(2)-PP-dolichol translocation protein RFT1 n=1 Tax=Linnemannia schmuckeri TaxID=64567 RepID=A0A9P5RYK6_9FUNG|nr:Oligosaccharide translocation protein rft1 [Linnemannia schmuckeri]
MDTSGPTLRQRSVPTSDHLPTSPTSAPASSTDPANNVDLKSTDQASSILSSSVQGASYLVLLQFVSRMLTFTLNQVLLRFTSAETLGIASVQLELLLNTILFLSREGVRCAAIRVSDDSAEKEDETTSLDKKEKDKEMRIAPGSEAYRLQKLVNMVYAPIPVGALMTCLAVGYSLIQVTDKSEDNFPGYRLSIYLYGISALIELLAEPMFMVAQYKLWFKTRVSVEGTAVIVRCILTCALTIYGARAEVTGSSEEGSDKNTMGVLAFAIAQFVYGLLTLGGFLLAFWSKSTERRDLDRKRMAAAIKKRDGIAVKGQPSSNDDTISMSALLPRRLTKVGKDGKVESFYFDKELLKLSKTLTSQSLLKHILTEGDKMMMAKFADETAQGVYAFVVNYGSLIARILFQPLEETSRTLFSRLLSDIAPGSTSSNNDTTAEKTNTTTTTSRTLTETQLDNLVLSRNLLLTIMKFHVLLGLVFIAFGTHYTATLIDLVVGQYWSTTTKAPQVLSLYCYYVPIMGLNGITEAVVQAVASEKELGVLSYWMVGFSAVFCSTGAFLMGTLGLKAEGIVLANCVNLIMRIVWSMWFLSGYYGRYIPIAGTSSGIKSSDGGVVARFAYVPWQNIVPRPTVLVAFGAAFVLTAATEQWIGWQGLYNKAVHLGIGVAAFAVVMGVVFVSEKQFLRDIQSIVRQRRR